MGFVKGGARSLRTNVAAVGVSQFFEAGFGFFAFAAGFDGDGDSTAGVGSRLGFAFEVAITTPGGLRFLQLGQEGGVVRFGCLSLAKSARKVFWIER